MKGYRISFKVVCISLLLFSIATVVSAQSDWFEDAERRALSEVMEPVGLGKEREVKVTTETGVKLTVAQMVYKEHASIANTESEWKTQMIKAEVSASVYVETDAGNDIGLELGLGLFRTTTDEENWDSDNIIVKSNEIKFEDTTIVDQKNDTEAHGWAFKIGLGYIHDLYGSWDIKQKLFWGRRETKFKRKDFEYTAADPTDPVPPGNIVVEEKVTLYYIEYNPTFDYKMGKNWALFLSPSFAYVPKGKAYNRALNITFNSDQGIIARCEGRLNYKFTKTVTGYIGGMGEWQYLEGDVKTEKFNIINSVTGEVIRQEIHSVEWSDNDLYTYGVVVGLTFDL